MVGKKYKHFNNDAHWQFVLFSSRKQIHPNLPLCLAILLGRYALFYMASFPSVGVPLWAFFKTLDAH